MSVMIVDSGVANLASVRQAFTRLDIPVDVATIPDDVRAATHLVLPGVGSFAAGMTALRARGLDEEVRQSVKAGVPLLGICLGMQLLCDWSEESPGMPGLGIVPGHCRRLPDEVRVPHLGWNRVAVDGRCAFLRDLDAAFANSYALQYPPDGWAVGWSTYGAPFVAALERGNVVACQFHPELSGDAGADLLRRWYRGAPGDPVMPAPQEDVPQRSGPGRSDLNVDVATTGLAVRIVPCLDVRDGRVVKGVRFGGLRDAGDPAERAAEYERQGADEVVMLDVAASPGAREHQLETVRRVREVLRIPLTVGGGVRSVGEARRLLDAGADRVSVNSAAVARPALLRELASEFGRQCVVLAVDARRCGPGWSVLVMGGRDDTGLDAVAWAREGTGNGAGEVLLTSWDRDGTRSGCDLALLRAVSAAVSVPVIASGGVGTPADAADAVEAGAGAVLAASILHDGDGSVTALKSALASRGVRIRS